MCRQVPTVASIHPFPVPVPGERDRDNLVGCPKPWYDRAHTQTHTQTHARRETAVIYDVWVPGLV